MNILSKNNNFHYLSNDIITQNHLLALLEKCPNTEFFLVRIFLHSDRIRPDKTPYLDTFHAVNIVLRKRSWLLYLYFPLKKFKVTSDYSTKANSWDAFTKCFEFQEGLHGIPYLKRKIHGVEAKDLLRAGGVNHYNLIF